MTILSIQCSATMKLYQSCPPTLKHAILLGNTTIMGLKNMLKFVPGKTTLKPNLGRIILLFLCTKMTWTDVVYYQPQEVEGFSESCY